MQHSSRGPEEERESCKMFQAIWAEYYKDKKVVGIPNDVPVIEFSLLYHLCLRDLEVQLYELNNKALATIKKYGPPSPIPLITDLLKVDGLPGLLDEFGKKLHEYGKR
jgi:hypothetical protein